MCGIAGLISLSSDSIPHLQKRMRVMNDAIAHRGPDGEGFWSHETDRVGLAHRRLSIIDLDKRSAQPMHAQSGNILTFNGEIYNYVELEKELSSNWNYQTRSDTESILAAYAKYGQSCLDHLRGMFAFALWNESDKTLFAAVDPMGIKPFYYTIQEEVFYFASEMKALLPFLPSIETDRHGLTEYVAFQLPISEQTLFKGIKRLLPGNKLCIKNGTVKITEYWTAKYATEADAGKLSPGDVIDKARQVIDQSVTQHLRSDVPVGSYLSGGVDSGLIATLATDHDAGAGICFHGKFTDYPGHDESHHARAIAEKNNLTLHETVITADDFKDNVKDIIYHLDTPVAGVGSFPQYMVSKLAKSHVKVVLGGQGGDELFGGYARYLVGYLDALIGAGLDGQLNDSRFPISMGELAPNLTLLRDYKPMLKKFWGGGLFEDFTHRYFRLCDRSLDLKDEIDHDILVKDYAFETFAEVFDRENAVPDKNPINQMLHFDMKRLLPGLLQVEDRMSMAHGLEARVPLVDREVAELAMSIPASVKFAGGQMKSILKDAFGNRLPDSVLNREDKMGFPVPISHWYKKELSGFMEDVFESDAARSRGIFNTKKIMENLDKDLPFSRKTWGLLSLELWHQNFHDNSSEIKFDPSKVN